MDKRVYINGIASISAQPDTVMETEEFKEYTGNIFPCIAPNYKKYIKPMMLRRMSKAVKIGLVAAKKALNQAKIEQPEAIIVGTGQGCKQDTENFLENLLHQNENLLSPTSFIQSTHNTIAGQIALDLKCTAYNMTYTQNSTSFESGLIDALTLLKTNIDIQDILVGGVDEISENLTSFMYLDEQLKKEEISNFNLFKENSPGTITSEGANFFIVSSIKKEDTFAEILDVKIQNKVQKEQVMNWIEAFLLANKLRTAQVDCLILGKNGDNRYDDFYSTVQEHFSKTCHLGYKHLLGDYNSVSSYAVWMACNIFKYTNCPELFKLNEVRCNQSEFILLYNLYLGKNHSLILLKK